MAEKKLRELKPGQRAKVVKVAGQGPIFRRILDMGVVRGAEVLIERIAPLGDPIEIKIRGYHLSLRKSEAENIFVEEL
ncbi:ferrous iron transport protein A [Candidatus Omnitrophota bacterium]